MKRTMGQNRKIDKGRGMLRYLVLLTTSVLLWNVCATETFGQRGRGGGMGGGARSSFSGGHVSGSNISSRSPSMSRPSTQMHSPAQTRPAPARPAAQPPRVGNQGNAALQSRSAASRPTQGQLESFLNSPNQTRSSTRSQSGPSTFSSTPENPSTLPANPGGKRSFTTEGGATITVGGGHGTVQGEGGTVGGAAGGIKIETANGETYFKGGGAIGATDGTNSAVAGRGVTARQNEYGSAAKVSGGYADSSGYRQGGSVTAVQGAGGYTAVNVRGGYGSGGTGQVGSKTAIVGPNGNVVTAGRGATFVNGQFVGGSTWSAVNGNYTHWNYYSPNWYAQYPSAWWPGKWAVATTAWAVATWPYASAYSGTSGEPVYYDYGETVTYDDSQVYVDGEPVASTEEYYSQASDIADKGAETANEDWMPLGVFAIVSEEEQARTDRQVQLAINRDAVIRGNYQDQMTGTVTPVTGSVDKESQRVSLKLSGNEQLVVETGLYNLTNDEVPVLVHFGPERRENRLFIRLQPPADAASK
ncbi:MAG: hypothetical protein KF851_12590 [Pirellulaceae bacterium]|nr:hypothetical protein [Pirellulaceae bacterium]